MGKDLMGRKDFFKYLLGQTKSITAQVAEDLLEPFHQAEETAKSMLVHKLIPIEEYGNTPKLLSSQKPPMFLVGEAGKNLTGVSAQCRKDGFLLNYLPKERALFCPMCNTIYTIDLGEESVKTDLTVYPLAIKEGWVYKI